MCGRPGLRWRRVPPGLPSGKTDCTGFCADLNTDKQHCGDCYTRCGNDQRCSSGSCICGYGQPSPCSDGQCPDLQSDPDNCGACGKVCGSELACVSGQCVSPARYDAVRRKLHRYDRRSEQLRGLRSRLQGPRPAKALLQRRHLQLSRRQAGLGLSPRGRSADNSYRWMGSFSARACCWLRCFSSPDLESSPIATVHARRPTRLACPTCSPAQPRRC